MHTLILANSASSLAVWTILENGVDYDVVLVPSPRACSMKKSFNQVPLFAIQAVAGGLEHAASSQTRARALFRMA